MTETAGLPADDWREDWPRTPAGLVGRVDEMHTVIEFAKAAVDGNPAMVRIEGDTGLGKTVLARAAVESLAGFLVVWVACHDTESGIPFGAADQIVYALRRIATERGIPIPKLDRPVQNPVATGRILLSVLDQVQRVQPVLLVLDDVQWCDEQSLASLGYLLRRLRIGRVLLLALTARLNGHPLTRATENGQLGNALLQRHLSSTALETATLRLRALEVEELLEMARLTLGRTPDPALADRLVRLSGGNPRIARLLIDGADADRSANGLVLPPSLLTAFGDQLSTLPGHARDMLDALAILGSPARIAEVAQLAGATDHVSSLDYLLERGLITWSPQDLPVQVSIPDPLLADAVYQLLGPRRRRDLHSAAAELVPGSKRWGHRTAAAVGVNPALAAELETEAAVAVGQSRVDQAVRYLRWAADLSDDRQGYDRTVLTAAVLELWWGRVEDADQLERAILATAPGPLRHCALGLLRGRRTEGLPEAAELLRNCLSANPDGSLLPRWITLLAASALARAELMLGDLSGAFHYARAVLDHIDEADPSVLARTARTLAFAVLGLEGSVAALTVLGKAELEIGRTSRMGTERIFDFERATLLLLGGQLSAAVSRAEAALAVAEHPAGDTTHHGATLVLAEAQYHLGGWARAREAVEQAIRMVDDGTLPASAIAPAHVLAAMVAAGHGWWKRAEFHIGQLDRVPAVRAEHRQLYQAIARASVARALGDPAAMLAAFAQLPPRFGDDPLSYQPWVTEISWRPLLAEALVEAGDVDAAAGELRRLDQLAKQAGHLRITHLWLSGRLADRAGDPQQARRYYEQAVARSAELDDTPLSRAHAELAYGMSCHRRGEDRKATFWLDRARQRLTRLGAVPYVERCDRALLAASQAPVLRRAELTDRELQVAGLVSKNLTNHQVADMLFVSEKTVEYHLGKVFAKLGISSRRQLRDLGPALRAATEAVERPPLPDGPLRFPDQRG